MDDIYLVKAVLKKWNSSFPKNVPGNSTGKLKISEAVISIAS